MILKGKVSIFKNNIFIRFLRIVKSIIQYKPVQEHKYSETSKCRDSLARFCKGDGVDLGFGGDPIVPHAICMDMPSTYANYEDNVQHLHGDARNLYWFADDSLDFLYSSHLLEDFEDTSKVLKEWLRVIKPGGLLILFLPDEQAYRTYCKRQGKLPNAHHIHDYFSLIYMKKLLETYHNIEIIHEVFPSNIYSFELVLQKKIAMECH